MRGRNPLIVREFEKMSIQKRMTALMTIEKKPKVKKIRGLNIIFIIGLKVRLMMAKINTSGTSPCALAET